jgi:hypothetical protein
MRTRYDILINWGAWKAGQYVMLKTVPTELIQMGVLEEYGGVATFDITHDANCDITYDDTADYKIGDTVVLTITVTDTYAIRSLLVNDIEMVELIDNDDMTLTLTVAQISNVINITSGVLASVTITDSAESHTTYEKKDYFVGDTVIFNLSFDEGYGLSTVEFNGVDVTFDVVDNTLTKVLIAAANTLNVTSKTTGQ